MFLPCTRHSKRGRLLGSQPGLALLGRVACSRQARLPSHAAPPQLARLLALSQGEAELTQERWHAMRALEGARAARLAAPQAART